MSVSNMSIDVNDLANFIFKVNDDKELFLNVKSLKTKKDLFFFLFDIFCKGIILLYGKDNKMKLNSLELHQFEEIKQKLRFAHIQLNLITYDKETAKVLEYLPDNDDDIQEKNIIQGSIDKIMEMDDNDDLSKYIFHLYMNDTLFCINFDILY